MCQVRSLRPSGESTNLLEDTAVLPDNDVRSAVDVLALLTASGLRLSPCFFVLKLLLKSLKIWLK